MTGWFSGFMNHPATYLHTGWLQISISNLLVIVLMLLVFTLAVVIPFPGDKK